MKRRNFLKKTAFGTVGMTLLSRNGLGGKGSSPPSQTLNLARIGVAGAGFGPRRNTGADGPFNSFDSSRIRQRYPSFQGYF
jgi:hypothetical protein